MTAYTTARFDLDYNLALALRPPAAVIATPGFQPPRYVEDVSDCFFYQSMKLPGLGLQTGAWDLRENVDAYLGAQNYAGKRVIDIGTASGYLAFEMEKRGAEVVALERLPTVPTDEMGLVPFADFSTRFGETIAIEVHKRVDYYHGLQNSFWMAHRLLCSKLRLYCVDSLVCPSELGEFDYAFFGSILLHLRDPLQALTTFARKTRERIIITESLEDVGDASQLPVMFLRPNIQDSANLGTWWYLTPVLLKQFLEILGFPNVTISYHSVRRVPEDSMCPFYTVVGSRS